MSDVYSKQPPVAASIFFTSATFFQQTGVHLFVSLTLAHTLKYPDTWVSVQGRSAAPRGTNGRTALCGQGGGGARRWGRAVSLLESHRRIWSETETRRLTETAHSCEAAVSLTSCTLRPFKLPLCVFKPFFFSSLSLCCPSLRLPPAESTRSSGRQDNGGLMDFLFFLFFYFSGCTLPAPPWDFSEKRSHLFDIKVAVQTVSTWFWCCYFLALQWFY